MTRHCPNFISLLALTFTQKPDVRKAGLGCGERRETRPARHNGSSFATCPLMTPKFYVNDNHYDYDILTPPNDWASHGANHRVRQLIEQSARSAGGIYGNR